MTSDPSSRAVVLAEELPTATVAPVEGNDAEAMTDSEDEEDAITRPDGWTEGTHGKSAEPDYGVVFSQDDVNRIDITMAPETWQAMLDDMADLYGQFGSRPNGGGARGDVRPPRAQGSPQGEAPLQRLEGAPQGTENPRVPQPGGDVRAPIVRTGNDDTNPIWVPVTIDFEGHTWTDVGLRLKGNSSLRSTWQEGNTKLPFRLDFDQFEDEFPEIDDQRFYGFQKATFSSNFKDASFLREKVTADLFREAGVPAAHTAFYEVYIDCGEGPTYFGLYTMVEVIEDTVIEVQFDEDDGNVYKPNGTGASFAEGSFSEASFDKQTNEDEADWSDILALYDALHAYARTTDPAAWRAELETIFDVDGFLNYLATNQVVQNWDTYGNIAHNYYLYHDPTTDLLTWIPWDNNMALNADVGVRSVLSLALDEVDTQWPLIRYLLDDEVYHAQYVSYVETFIDAVFEPEELARTYRGLAALVEPFALAENEGYTFLRSDAAFHNAIDALIAHAADRYEAAAAYVAGQ